MKSTSFILPALAVIVLSASGCINLRSTSYRKVERLPVTFSTERAGRLFYETLNRLPPDRREKSEAALVLVALNVSSESLPGPDSHYNDCVRWCDTDRDGTITEEEAQIFATSFRFPGSAPKPSNGKAA